MFNLPAIRIGRIFGIPLEVNLSWLVILALVVLSLSFGYLPEDYGTPVRLVTGLITALLFFASIVAHEVSHSLVARAGGTQVDKVTLFLFGGVAQMEEEPTSAGREFVMAVAGPMMSVLLAAIFYIALMVAEARGVEEIVTAPLLYLAFVNFYVAAFNLLPGFPLDGGRVLRSLIWAVTGNLLTATKWACLAGQTIGYAMLLGAVWGVLGGNPGLLWLGLVGWFIANLAENAYRQVQTKSILHGFRVSQLMSPDPAMAPGEITLEELVRDYFVSGRHSRYPVMYGGEVVGLISLALVKEVPRAEWSLTRVVDVALRDTHALVVDHAAPADELLDRFVTERPGALLVSQDGRLVGIVTRADILSKMRTVAA